MRSADAECGCGVRMRSADAECGCACRSVLKVAAERPLNMAPPDVAAAPRPRRDRVQPSRRQSAAIRSTTPAPRSGSTSHTPVSAEVGAASESDGAPDQWNGLRGLLARRCPTQDTAVPGHRRAPCEPVERDATPYPVADSRSRRRPEKKGANVRIDRRRPDAREPGGEDMNRSELAADIATQPFLPKSAADRVVGAVFIAIRRGARARRTRGPCGLREPHRQATPGPTGTEPAYRREHRHRRVHGAVVHGGQGASRRRHQGAHMHRPPDSAPRPMSGPQTHRPRRGPLCNASPPPRPHAPRLNSGRFLPDCLISAYSGEADRRFRCEADHPVRAKPITCRSEATRRSTTPCSTASPPDSPWLRTCSHELAAQDSDTSLARRLRRFTGPQLLAIDEDGHRRARLARRRGYHDRLDRIRDRRRVPAPYR